MGLDWNWEEENDIFDELKEYVLNRKPTDFLLEDSRRLYGSGNIPEDSFGRDMMTCSKSKQNNMSDKTTDHCSNSCEKTTNANASTSFNGLQDSMLKDVTYPIPMPALSKITEENVYPSTQEDSTLIKPTEIAATAEVGVDIDNIRQYYLRDFCGDEFDVSYANNYNNSCRLVSYRRYKLTSNFVNSTTSPQIFQNPYFFQPDDASSWLNINSRPLLQALNHVPLFERSDLTYNVNENHMQPNIPTTFNPSSSCDYMENHVGNIAAGGNNSSGGITYKRSHTQSTCSSIRSQYNSSALKKLPKLEFLSTAYSANAFSRQSLLDELPTNSNTNILNHTTCASLPNTLHQSKPIPSLQCLPDDNPNYLAKLRNSDAANEEILCANLVKTIRSNPQLYETLSSRIINFDSMLECLGATISEPTSSLSVDDKISNDLDDDLNCFASNYNVKDVIKKVVSNNFTELSSDTEKIIANHPGCEFHNVSRQYEPHIYMRLKECRRKLRNKYAARTCRLRKNNEAEMLKQRNECLHEICSVVQQLANPKVSACPKHTTSNHTANIADINPNRNIPDKSNTLFVQHQNINQPGPNTYISQNIKGSISNDGTYIILSCLFYSLLCLLKLILIFNILNLLNV